MVDSPTPKSPPKTPPKNVDGLSSAAPKKPDDQSSGSPKSSDKVEGLGKTSPKNDGDAIASPNDDAQSHSPPSGVDESWASPKDDTQSYSPPKGVDESCASSGRAEGTPPRVDSPSVSTATKSPIDSTHSHSPSKDVDESCVLTPLNLDSQGDSLNITMTGLDGLTPMSVLRQVASKVGSNFLKTTVAKGRRTFGQLKQSVGKFSVNSDSSPVTPMDTSAKPMESPGQQWSQEPALKIMSTVQAVFFEVGAKYTMFSPDIISRVSIWFVENDVESWDKLQGRIESIFADELYREAIWGIVNRFFMYPRHKVSVVRKLIVESIMSTTWYMAFEARRQILLNGSNKTFIDFTGFRMFKEEGFRTMWAIHMKDQGYPFTKEMLDRLKAGVEPISLDSMCVDDTDPIALFLATWEARPHKDSTELLRAYSQAHYEVLPAEPYFQRKEGALLYDKGKVINLDGSPIDYFFMLYAKAFEKAVYVGATLLLDKRETLLRQEWRMVGIDSWRSLMRNASSSKWCDTLEGVTKALLVDFWPDDCPEELKKVQEYALILIPPYLAHYAFKFLNKESSRYLKDLSLFGNKGFYDNFSAAVLSLTPVKDGFEEPEDTLIADALATAEKRNLEEAEKQLGKIKGDADEVMKRLNAQKALDEKDEDVDAGQLDISPVISSGSSSVLSPNSTVTGSQLKMKMPCSKMDDVAYPHWSPPRHGTHLQGFWGNSLAGTVVWKSYIPPLKYEELPANIKFIDKHWEGRLLPDGTTFVGKKPDSTPVFGHVTPAAGSNDKLDARVPGKLQNQGAGGLSAPGSHVAYQAESHVRGNDMKPGAYVPGGVPRPMRQKGNDVSFSDNVEQYTIPPRPENPHDAYESYYGHGSRAPQERHQDESFPGAESNVPSMAERIRKASKTVSIVTARSPVLHWSQAPGVGSTRSTFPTAFDFGNVQYTDTPRFTSYVKFPNTVDPHQHGGNPGRSGSGGHPSDSHFTGGLGQGPTPPYRNPGGFGSDPNRGFGGSGSGDPYRDPDEPGGNRDPDGPGGGPPNPPNPPSVSSGVSGRGGAKNVKRFTCKPDITQYKEYKDHADYNEWIDDTVVVMRAQGLGDLLNPNYRPTPDDEAEFFTKQAFVYMMLKKKVLIPTGEQILNDYKASYDAQAVLAVLAEEALTSTSAVLSSRALLNKIVSSRFDPRNARVNAIQFIADFQKKVSVYNEQQPSEAMKLNDEIKKSLLQASMSNVSILRAVGEREQDSVIRGSPALTYANYLVLLKSAATLYDEQSSGRRQGNVHDMSAHHTEGHASDEDIAQEIAAFMVNSIQRRTPGASMNKDTWESLSPEGRETWDKMDSGDKRKVLQYAKQRADKKTMDANAHESNPPDESTLDDEDDKEAPEVTETEVNNAVTKARKSSHPGDARRVMGSTSGTKTKKTGQVNHVDFTTFSMSSEQIDAAINDYWNEDSESDDEQDF